MNDNPQTEENKTNSDKDSNPHGNSVLNKKTPSKNVISGDVPKTTPTNGQNNPPADEKDIKPPDRWEKKHSTWNIWVQTLLAVFNLVMIGLFIISMTCQNRLTRLALEKTDTANININRSLVLADTANAISNRMFNQSKIMSDCSFVAAKKSSDVYEALTRDELRAYLVIQNFRPIKIQATNPIQTFYDVVNVGKTPAVNFTAFHSFILINVDKSEDDKISREVNWVRGAIKRHTTEGSIIGGSGPFCRIASFDKRITPDDSVAIVTEKKRIYLIVLVSYFDKFNIRRETMSCYYFPADGKSVGIYRKYNYMN